jgi:hypothetical protein
MERRATEKLRRREGDNDGAGPSTATDCDTIVYMMLAKVPIDNDPGEDTTYVPQSNR